VKTLLRHLAAAVVVGGIVWALTLWASSFLDYEIAEASAYVSAVAGLSVLIGLSGQISVGNGAFMAVGGYGTALLLLHQHWPLAAVIAASTALAAAVGGLVGVAAARLRGPYLAGATLLFAVAIPVTVADHWSGLFGGDQGLAVAVSVPTSLAGNPTRYYAWLTTGVALITLVLLANLGRSRIGRSWRALRDDEVAAALCGLNVARLQVLAFVISAACAGVGGALLATVQGTVGPGDYTLTLSIGLLTAAVLGGLGSLAGAVWGSLLLVFAPTYLQDVAASHGLTSGAVTSIPIAAYGLVLIVVMLVFPSGIQGALRRLSGLIVPATSAPLSALRRRRPAAPYQEASPYQKEGS
jgi:branched-chain amino acid transport system permease protein